jgi:hypothetical protein
MWPPLDRLFISLTSLPSASRPVKPHLDVRPRWARALFGDDDFVFAGEVAFASPPCAPADWTPLGSRENRRVSRLYSNGPPAPHRAADDELINRRCACLVCHSGFVILSGAGAHASAESKDLCIFFFLQLRKPTFRQILPRRIHADNQLDFLDPCPALQLLFTGNGVIHSLELFPIHEPIHPVTAGESFENSGLVLKDAQCEFAGNTDIQRL